MRFYSVLRAGARGLLKLLFRFSVVGSDRVPSDGGCLVAVNHISFWDPLILASAIRNRELVFLARQSLFSKPVVGFLLRRLHAVPVKRDGDDLAALRTMVKLLKEGNAVAIYPQGTRCPGVPVEETAFQSGAVFAASLASCPLIPVGVSTKKARIRLFRKVVCAFGTPMKIASGRDRTMIDADTRTLKENIARLTRVSSSSVRGGAACS